MQTSNNNTTNTTLNQLVYEPVAPINPSNKEEQASINPINPPGNLAEQAGPVLSTRKAQPIAINLNIIKQHIYDAKQARNQGKVEEAVRIYISIVSNTEADIRDRLICAKKLLKINSQAPSAANLLEWIAKDANIEAFYRLKAIKTLLKCPEYQNHAGDTLLWMAKDTKLDEDYRLKAIKILAKWPDFQERALSAFEAFSAVFDSQAIRKSIQDTVGDCIAPILLAKAQDHRVWPLERIEAAKKLTQISRQKEKAAELLIMIAEQKNYHSSYHKEAARIVSKLKSQEAHKRGKELLKAIEIEKLVRQSLPKDKKQANPCYTANCMSARYYSAERLLKISGQEKKAAEVLKSILDDKQIPLVHRIEAAEKLSAITQGRELVDFLFTVVRDLTVLSFNRIEAAEKLSTLVGEDRQGEIWSALINERLTYIHPNYGIKVAEKLGKIQGYEAVAAGYLLYLGRIINNYIPWNIQAFQKLAKIPGYEASAAECLLSLHQSFKKNNNHHDNIVYFNQWETAEALSAIPGAEENAATVLLNLTKGDLSRMLCFHHTGERLSKLPGQEEKSKEAWDYIASYDGSSHSHPGVVGSRILATTALIELFGGDKEMADAAEILTKLAQDETKSLEHRILAVDNLQKIPGQEAEVEKWRIKLNTTQETTKNTITTAKDLLQVPEEKEKAANDLLKIAKNPVLAFSDRILAGDTLSAVPEQEPKAIEAWLAMNACSKLIQYKRTLAAGKLSHIPGQADNARKLVDHYMIQISDTDQYFQV